MSDEERPVDAAEPGREFTLSHRKGPDYRSDHADGATVSYPMPGRVAERVAITFFRDVVDILHEEMIPDPDQTGTPPGTFSYSNKPGGIRSEGARQDLVQITMQREVAEGLLRALARRLGFSVGESGGVDQGPSEESVGG